MHFLGQINAYLLGVVTNRCTRYGQIIRTRRARTRFNLQPRRKSRFLLVADHAGNLIPRVLGRLGLIEADCRRHIAWDIGVAGLAQLLADQLDANLIKQNYSRLVIDCNRPLDAATSIPKISENTQIPGNADVNERDRAARIHEIFEPYHAQIEAELDRRQRANRPTALIALHSFVPMFKGARRPWHAGVLYK